ncbi:hypothetical protein, partial [Massilia sp. Root335]|uniref:hypothetical protein n=2 Tax=Bacteria TaxID=2 RepID=UPI001E60BD91
MGTHISVIGNIKEIRTFDDKPFVCLEVSSIGKYGTVQKGLPEPTREIHHTVLVSKKQLNRIEKEVAPFDVPLLGSEVYVWGIPTFDLTYDVLEGDFGIITQEIKSLTARKTELDWIERGAYF